MQVLLFVIALTISSVDYSSALKCTPWSRMSSLQGKMGFPEQMAEETDDGGSEEPEMPMIPVRFTNTPRGKDILIEAPMGGNLMQVGDKNGVVIPRACRTGLCGTCTVEVKDPNAIATASNPRQGYATLRACSTKCFLPEGVTEMVVDMGRIKEMGNTNGDEGDDGLIAEKSKASNPLARFSGDWEREFKPSWELSKGKDSIPQWQQNNIDNTKIDYGVANDYFRDSQVDYTTASAAYDPYAEGDVGPSYDPYSKEIGLVEMQQLAEQARGKEKQGQENFELYERVRTERSMLNYDDMTPAASGRLNKGTTVCNKCGGSGRSKCYTCGGTGTVDFFDHNNKLTSKQCSMCLGLAAITCSKCKGSGIISKRGPSGKRIKM